MITSVISLEQTLAVQSPVQIVDDDTPAQPTTDPDGDALVKGLGIWDNEW